MVLDDLIEKATNEGREEGREEERLELIAKYLSKNPNCTEAAELFDLPIEFVKKVAQETRIILDN